jgi:hypothetical protein
MNKVFFCGNPVEIILLCRLCRKGTAGKKNPGSDYRSLASGIYSKVLLFYLLRCMLRSL